VDLLRETIADMRGASLDAWVAGGWAEELRGLSRPRAHEDIDLFLHSPGFQELDAQLTMRTSWEEIQRKRWSHKRAWVVRGIMVECILVRPDYSTSFFDDRLVVDWPRDIFQGEPTHIGGLPLISRSALELCRARYPEMARAREEWGAAQHAF